MDLAGSGDAYIRHVVTLEPLDITHPIRLSSSFIPVSKHLKQCVYAVAGVWALVKIATLVTAYRARGKESA